MVIQALYLPLRPEAAPELHGVPGRAGLEHLWVRDESWLLLPSHVVAELSFERAWNVGLLTTPSSLGSPYPEDELTQVAWMVIASAPLDQVVRLMCGVAALLDEFMDGQAVSVGLAIMAQPGELTGRLVSAARAGKAWLYGRCLRWIARERTMAALGTGLCPWRCPPPWPLLAALFPRVTAALPASDADLLRAAWFLHDAFMGSGFDEEASLADAARVTTALTYRTTRPGDWLGRLAVWSRIWQVDDSHGVAATPQGWGGPLPSVLRARAADQLGMTVDEWFGTIAAILTQLILAHAQGTLAIATRRGYDKMPMVLEDGEEIVIDAAVAVRNILTHGSATLDQLAASLVDDVRRSSLPYRGYGTLPQHEANAMRRQPVIAFEDGSWVISDVGAFVEWATDLPLRLAETGGGYGRRTVRSTAGLMFEAYALDHLMRLAGRHRVTPGRELDNAVPADHRRPDALVANNDGMVAIETSLKPLGAGIAAGDLGAFDRLVEQYVEKAKQARAVLNGDVDLDRFKAATSTNAPTYIVVTDVPATYVPPLASVLRERDPEGIPRFVCGIEDLVMLVDLCTAGWSFPAAVMAWQQGQNDLPLRTHLERLAGLRSPSQWSNVEALGPLIRSAPRARSEAA